MTTRTCLTLWIVHLAMGTTAHAADLGPSFVQHIRPILAAKCFQCHGPDGEHREADLRLDVRQEAVDYGALVPGQADESELILRIESDDPDLQMPPPAAEDPLTDQQKQQLRQWVAAGAKYEKHWAFLPPTQARIPPIQDPQWARSALDHFVLAQLQSQHMQPSAQADRYTLVRRLYLDLIGLPPTPEEADEFALSNDPLAEVRLVDRLLASPHYGERWARQWLDLARYADTNGYEKDRPRSIWPYRDWVIEALNDDLPFDQFSVEQLAGDMLPQATTRQRVATGFHRNTMLNEEGGIDPLEYRFYAMVDRVATTGTVWLGLTIGCAQCHSHKFDPISHTDYYRLMALLNNADEPDLFIRDEQTSELRRHLQDEIARLESELPNHFPPIPGAGPASPRRQQNLRQHFKRWLGDVQAQAGNWTVLRPHALQSNLPQLQVLQDGSILSSGDITKRDVFRLQFQLRDLSQHTTALRLEVLPDARLPAGGPGRAYYEGRKGDFFLSELSAWINDRPLEFSSASHSYGKISVGSGSAEAANVIDGKGSTGWSTSGGEGQAHQLVLNLTEALPAQGELRVELLFERHFAASLGRFRLSAAAADGSLQAKRLPVALERILARDAASWTTAERDRLQDYFLQVTPELTEPRKRIEQLREQLPVYPVTLVMQQRPEDQPRKTFRHHRGEFLSVREEVRGGIPEVLDQAAQTSGPEDRLALARWLVSRRNPLAARVTVNRAWQAMFGMGIVRTSGDFGTQSEPPSHPQLLDWLACELIEQGWSLKRLHRMLVTSATYRQSSRVSPERLRRDPQNRLLARGPRYRVDAEMVRDIMLQASGLLSSKMYGPSVYPPQPASVTALAYGKTKWPASSDRDRYRRSLYTFSKRTAPFAAYTVFDSPTGESCIARRDRSNTPLQALTLLNDEMFLEMARAMAKIHEPRMQHPQMTEDFGVIEAIASDIFRRLASRPPSEEELRALIEYQRAQAHRLETGELNAETILAPDEPAAKTAGPHATQLAAWTMVARVIMNLDEAITKP